jgi:hypothetical protein
LILNLIIFYIVIIEEIYLIKLFYPLSGSCPRVAVKNFLELTWYDFIDLTSPLAARTA